MFAYAGLPGLSAPPACQYALLSGAHEDGCQALEALDAALGGPAATPVRNALVVPPRPSGALTPMTLAQAIAHLSPEHCVIVDEALTTSLALAATMGTARPFELSCGKT